MARGRINLEHNGAKNGGGFWGTRADAKDYSKKARRGEDRQFSLLVGRDVPEHDCVEFATHIVGEMGGAWECTFCGKFLQAG